MDQKNRKSLLTDEQAEELFSEIEERYNEKAYWAPLISQCGGNLQFVSFDIQEDPHDPEFWLFVAVLSVAESFTLSDEARSSILEDLEGIVDDLQDAIEEAGFDLEMTNGEEIEIQC